MNEANDLAAAVGELVTENGNLKRKSADAIRLNEAHLECIKRLQAIVAKFKRDNAETNDELQALQDKVKILREKNANLHERYIRASRRADAAGKPSQNAADMGHTLTPEQVATQGKMLDDALKQNAEWLEKSKAMQAEIDEFCDKRDARERARAVVARDEAHKDAERHLSLATPAYDKHAYEAMSGVPSGESPDLAKRVEVVEERLSRVEDGIETLKGRVSGVQDKLRDVVDINGYVHTLFESDIQPFDDRLKLVEELCKLRFPTSRGG